MTGEIILFSTKPPVDEDAERLREVVGREIIALLIPGLAADDAVRLLEIKHPGLTFERINSAFAYCHKVISIFPTHARRARQGRWRRSVTIYVRPHLDQLDKLVKILGRLGSDNTGERDAAALKAVELLKSLGMTWDDVILPQQKMLVGPTDKTGIGKKLTLLRDNIDALSDWERGFVVGLKRFRRLSPKQLAVIDKLVAKVRDLERQAA